jgi:hypothetical protein
MKLLLFARGSNQATCGVARRDRVLRRGALVALGGRVDEQKMKAFERILSVKKETMLSGSEQNSRRRTARKETQEIASIAKIRADGARGSGDGASGNEGQ